MSFLPIAIALVALPAMIIAALMVKERPDLLVPLGFASMWFEGVGVGPLSVGRAMAIILLVAPVVMAMTTKWRPAAFQPRAWLPVFLVIMWGWCTGLWSVGTSQWISAVAQYGVALGFFLLGLLLIDSYEQAKAMLKLWLWVGVPVSIISDALYFVVAPTVLESQEGVRSFGFSGSPNNFALYLVIAIAVAIAFSRESTGKERRNYLLMVPLFVSALITSGSRAGLAGLAVLFLYIFATYGSMSIIKRISIFLGGTVALSVVGVGLIILNPRLNPLGVIVDRGSGRSDILTIGFAAAREHWTVGVGLGNFTRIASQYAHTTTGASLRNLKGVSSTLNPEIHSLYLELVAESGIFGLLFYAGMLAATMKNNWDLRRTEWRNLSWAITGAYIVFVLFAAQSPVGTQKMQWCIAGIVGAVYVRRRRQRRSLTPTTEPVAEVTAA